MKQKTIKQLLNFSLINLDKPTGPTSSQVSQFVKDALEINKTSHMGTLDPQVTGVLPITLGRACKLASVFLHKDKKYVGIMRLHEEVDPDKLKKEMKDFVGKITQLPPVRSNVKRDFREREVKQFEILEQNGKDVLFIANVEAGTYIRKLIHDLGEKLGGAHMLELRRVQASVFTENEESFVNLYDFEKAVQSYKDGNEIPLRKILVPAELAIKKVLAVYQIPKDNLQQILTGKPLMKSDLKNIPKENTFALFNEDIFVGVYNKVDEKDIIARPEFVYN